MGFDCTLHLVDEKAIREEFVPRLLGESQEETELDRVAEDAAELWETMRKALEEDDPEAAASLLCQLALKFSACSLPHQYERGFALSLWANQEEDIAVEYPGEFAFSPELLFARVVQKYPKLHGHFPMWFTGNWSTGVFIPSNRVPEVLAWIEKKINKFSKGDQRHFKGLLGILRAATDNKLAYWEATDLAFPMASQFPGDPNLMMARYLHNEPGIPGRQLEEAPVTEHFHYYDRDLADQWLVTSNVSPFETSFWDMSVWPPGHSFTVPEYAPYRAFSHDGQWLLFSEMDPKATPRNFRPRLFSNLSKKCDGEFPVVVDGKELSIRNGGFIGSKLLVFREPDWQPKVGDSLAPPLWLNDGQWQPAPGLAAVPAQSSVLEGFIDKPVAAIVRLADGTELLIWDGDGYELNGSHFEKTFAMRAKKPERTWTHVVSGTDGFFYLSNRLLFEVHRGNEPTPHASRWKNIMYVRPGPGGGILLQEGTNKDGDIAKLYFPATDTFIHIEPELFDDKDYAFIHWSEKADRFVVACDRFLAVRTATVLSLPRYRASTGRKVKD